MPPAHVVNQRIADRLLTDGRIGAAEHRQAVDHAVRNRGRIEDAIIDLGILTEADLLRYIATVHKTRFVGTDKLSKAAIDPRLLAKVSPKTAEIHGVFPVLFDEPTQKLSVVTADPDNGAALDELKLAAGVKAVRALVARPAAVKAAIARSYFNEPNAFAQIMRPVLMMGDMADLAPFEHTLPVQGARGSSPSIEPPSAHDHSALTPAPATASSYGDARAGSYGDPRTGSFAGPMPGGYGAAAMGGSFAGPMPGPTTGSAMMGGGQGSHAGPLPVSPPPVAMLPPTASPEFLEALNVLVTLLENGRNDLRGHSSRVARFARKVCDRMGLGAQQSAACVAAAYLHDLGKIGTYHLTGLNVAEYEGHQLGARKSFEMPARLTESVHLSPETTTAMRAMYERYDGKGFPDGLAGKEIPLGARILSVVDTFADVTQNPRNPFRKALRNAEACAALAKHRGTIFDPNVIDLLTQMMSGDDIRAKLFEGRYVALLVDPDPEETTVLELRLVDQGFEVKIARTAAQARRELEAFAIDVVVSEIDLEEPDAGLALRSWAARGTKGVGATWVIFTRKTDRASAQRAFDLGVDDVVSKPASTDILVAKLRQLIERRSSRQGVGGSLDEMSLPDVVQVLWHGRKTCALKVQSGVSGGEIHFHEGQVVNAQWQGLRGEEAFFRMLALRDGQFRIDLGFQPGPRLIASTPESLLLEAMRRIDESGGARVSSP